MGFLAVFFFCNGDNTLALETIVVERPIAEDITYGEPLFESELIGGKANVRGNFSWKNDRDIFEAGEHKGAVVFTPLNAEYDSVEIDVDFKVVKRRVYIKFEDEIYKQYDGTDVLDLPNYVVGGILGDGVYVKGNLEGSLQSVLIGINNVILKGISLGGDKAENYYLDLSGFVATVYPDFREKFGSIKHRVDFSKNIYVPVDSLLNVEKLESFNLEKKGYKIKEVYDIYLKSGDNRVDVHGDIKFKIKVDKSSFNYKRLELFNYYKGDYEKIEYEYKDGYILYSANSLGSLVFAEKELNLWWIYMLLALMFSGLIVTLVIKKLKGREKINKYRSLRRSKDYGDY